MLLKYFVGSPTESVTRRLALHCSQTTQTILDLGHSEAAVSRDELRFFSIDNSEENDDVRIGGSSGFGLFLLVGLLLLLLLLVEDEIVSTYDHRLLGRYLSEFSSFGDWG
jgi:hypothetical protein